MRYKIRALLTNKNETMKNENLPQVGRDVIFETVQNDVFAGVFNGSEYVVPFSNGKTTVFEGRGVVAWIYVEDALAAWKREQVRRVKIPPVNHVNTAILREEVLKKIQHEDALADVETALDKYVDAVVKNYEQPLSEDCIGITDLREQRRYEISKDILAAKCTRCKNVHFESERIWKKKKGSLWADLVCPRCGCKTTVEPDKKPEQK